MKIIGECWNIVVDEDMNNVPTSYPGSSSTKPTHDFCHLDSKASTPNSVLSKWVDAHSGLSTCLTMNRNNYGLWSAPEISSLSPIIKRMRS